MARTIHNSPPANPKGFHKKPPRTFGKKVLRRLKNPHPVQDAVRRGGWSSLGLLLLILAAIPLASARQATGYLSLDGPLVIEDAASGEGTCQGLFLPNTDALSDLTLVSASVNISVTTWNSTYLQGPTGKTAVDAPNPYRYSFEMHGLKLNLAAQTPGTVAGAMGVYPLDGLARVTMVAAGPTSVTTQLSPRLGDSNSTGDMSATPDHDYFSRVMQGPSTDVVYAGETRLRGGAVLWLRGPTIHLSGAEGERTIATGRWLEPDPLLPSVSHLHTTVAIITFQQGELTIQAAHPAELLAEGFRLNWTGLATMHATTGRLTSPQGAFTLQGPAPVMIAGTMRADVTSQEQDGGALSLLQVQGEISSTSMQVSGEATAPTGVGLVWFGIALGGAGLILAAGMTILLARRPHAHPALLTRIELEEVLVDPLGALQRSANAAIQKQRWNNALHYLADLKQLDPENPKTYADEALCHERLGDIDKALAASAEASRLSNVGEFDYTAALMAKDHGLPKEEVEALLEHALTRSPYLVDQVLEEGEFQEYAGRPRFEQMIRLARATEPLVSYRPPDDA